MMIRKLRLQKAWSQEQLAEFSGLSIRTVQRVEQGQPASLETLKSLAAVFEVNVSQLQRNTDMPFDPAPSTPSSASTVSQASLPLDEQQALYQVKKLKGFYQHLIRYVLIITFLALINYFTSPKYWWVLWTAAGWGLGLAAHALSAFDVIRLFGPDWEKRQIEKRLGRTL